MSTTRKRHTPLSHSARETWKQCPRKFHFQYNMRMEPVEKKSSLKMGIAFSEALEHRDPSRTAEGYWRDTPLHDRIMDRTAETEIAQVELLSALYLERYADDVAPGRIWTPEFEFKSELLGRGFLDAIIEESNGRESTCPVHGEGVGVPGHGMLDMDGGAERERIRNIRSRPGGQAGASPLVHALSGSDTDGHGDGPSLPGEALREPESSGARNAEGELPSGDIPALLEDALPARTPVLGGEHLPQAGRRAGVPNVREDASPSRSTTQDALSAGARVRGEERVHRPGDGVPEVQGLQQGSRDRPACSCRRTIGVENKLLGSFFWGDSARRTLAIDSQVDAYFSALREIGKPLDKMLYRVTKKPSIKPDSRKGESIPDYIKRLTERIEADPSYAFEQHELFRTDQQLDEFLEECAEVNEHVKLSRRREAWPKSTKACTMFGGCSFLPVCRNEVGLADQFRIRPLPAPKPKLPRLGKVQKAVLLALGDAFTSPIATSALAKQVAYAQPSVASALKSLQDRGFIADDGVIEGETYWDVMPEGRVVIDLLRGVSA